jgi:alpha-glucosidase
VFPRPSNNFVGSGSDLTFDFNEDPFSFSVSRASTGEVLFDTTGTALVFESQYVRLRTSLPQDANLYGLGESADPLRLPRKDYQRT